MSSLAAAHAAVQEHLSHLGSSTIKIDLEREALVDGNGTRAIPVIGYVMVTEAQVLEFTVPTVQGT